MITFRKLKMSATTSQFGTSMMTGMGDDLSVISETPSVFTGKVTHAEKNFSKIGGNRA